MFGQSQPNLQPQQSVGPLQGYYNDYLRPKFLQQIIPQQQPQIQQAVPQDQSMPPGLVDSMISKGLGVSTSSTPLQDYMTKHLMEFLRPTGQ